MTTLLAIDTATEACSVALLQHGQVLSRYAEIPRLHAQQVLPMVQQVLAEAGIGLAAVDAIAFGRGPGAFTGLRIATGVVQGMAFALDKPVLPISTLATIAQGVWRTQQAQKVAVAIDARMQEIYWGCYQLEQGCMQLVGQERVCAAKDASLPFASSDCHGAGTGWAAYADEFTFTLPLVQHNLPHAQDILSLALAAWQQGMSLAPEQALPVYLRDQVATPKS